MRPYTRIPNSFLSREAARSAIEAELFPDLWRPVRFKELGLRAVASLQLGDKKVWLYNGRDVAKVRVAIDKERHQRRQMQAA